MPSIVRIIVLFLLFLGLPMAATAAEEIRSFHALVDIGADGMLTVTETIAVNVEGREISRGIFRDIPLRYEDESGRTREVRLDVRSVRRNGASEPYVTERGSGMIRIRIGKADTLLSHGVHSYEITYETARQLRYFDDYDELYWNVTGNGWDFPILKSSAEIRLPAGGFATDVTWYTGRHGSTEQAAQARRLDGGNRIVVEAVRELDRQEGLTIAVAFPKGVVAPPSGADLRADWLRDNLGWIVGGGGLVVVLGFYVWAWRRVGLDPPKEIIVPRWSAPDGVSPALANYIEKRGFKGEGWDAFSASVIDLAVKGHLELEQPQKTMTIRRKGSEIPESLGVGRRAILYALPADGDRLTVDKSSGTTIQSVGRAFRKAMEREHRAQYYRNNSLYVAAGIFLSLAVPVLMILSGGFEKDMIGAAIGVILPSVLIAFIAADAGRHFRRSRSLRARISEVIKIAIFGFVGLNMAGVFLKMLMQFSFDPKILAIPAALIMVNIIFFFLMGAPTPIGQKRSAEIAGLKQYLTLAEKERMNMLGVPEMSPQHFETLLPYAVALGVEKPWSRAFDAWLATAMATGAVAAYAGPGWYRGSGFKAGQIGSGLGNMANSLSGSFTASLPAPKSSSSGFSGGSSGGGGGGGGGGGW